MHSWIIWAIITLVALLVEVLTLGFAVICFAVGALVACLLAFVGGGVMAQLVVFSVTTLVALIFIRPFVIKYLAKSTGDKHIETNTDALIGRCAIVTQVIRNGGGRVSVDGDDWKAQIDDDDVVIAVGERVEIVGVNSVILTIKKR